MALASLPKNLAAISTSDSPIASRNFH